MNERQTTAPGRPMEQARKGEREQGRFPRCPLSPFLPCPLSDWDGHDDSKKQSNERIAFGLALRLSQPCEKVQNYLA